MRWFGKKAEQLFSGTHRVFSRVVGILQGKKSLSNEDLLSLKHALIDADVGLELTDLAIEYLRKVCVQGVKSDDELVNELKKFLLQQFPKKPKLSDDALKVIMVVGVNGAGKTTTIAKLAKYFSDQGQVVAVAAGDTYRAAAAEQLSYWAEKSGAIFINSPNTKDPAAVVYEGFQVAKAKGATILLADTAGRMHSNQGLMDQLQKVKRVLAKQDERAPHEVWLVLDGSLGQSNTEQAKIFHNALGVTGVIVTKVDGAAKGGAVFSVARMGLPIYYVGSGESLNDLMEFSPDQFIETVLGE